jgi:hypothetical protein
MDSVLREACQQLILKYGEPRTVRNGPALRLAGLRSEIHPDDVFASLHDSREAAKAFMEANDHFYGHPNYGPFVTDNGFLVIADLRHVLADNGVETTDPKLPDR